MIKRFIPPAFKERLLKMKVTVGKNVKLSKGVKINKHSLFEGYNSLSNNTEFKSSYMGMGSYIATNSVVRYAKIGRYTAIGDNVRTGLGLHPSKKFVSIHPAFFSVQKQAGFTFAAEQLFDEHKFIDSENKYTCIIGNDVWIGSNSLLMDGISIGDGAIVGAGSVVTKDVPPYTIVGGVPAREIRKRFSEEEIRKLLLIEWWKWDLEKIKRASPFFTDIKFFIQEYDRDGF